MILINKNRQIDSLLNEMDLDSERIAINSLCDVAFRRTNDMLLELAKPISEYEYHARKDFMRKNTLGVK